MDDIKYSASAKAFLQGLSVKHPGYKTAELRYVASRRRSDFVILYARIVLDSIPSPSTLTSFASENIRAGCVALSALSCTPENILDRLVQGVTMKFGRLLFEPSNLNVRFQPLHPAGLQGQWRLSVLSLSGSPLRELIHQPMIDWELRAHRVPYIHIRDLLNDFKLGDFPGQHAYVEVVVNNLAAIGNSHLKNGRAIISYNLPLGLDQQLASIGCRIITNDVVSRRVTATGADLAWRDDGPIQIGTIEIETAVDALVHCIAVYDGVAQHDLWLSDLDRSPNPRRTILQQYDAQVQSLTAFLSLSNVKNRQYDFELGCAWLLWLLGFNACPLGFTKRIEGPDLIATTPLGHIIVVECTTGLLKADNKLAKLHRRAVELRRALSVSHPHIKVLPVIISALDKQSLGVEMNTAVEQGVIAVSQEDLLETLNRSTLRADPDQLYREMEGTLTIKDR